MNQGSNINNQGITTPQTTPFAGKETNNMSEMNDLLKYRMAYPEIYYKCQPFVMMACDQMDSLYSEMPTQEMIEEMSDIIYDDVCRIYPEMAEYMNSVEQKDDDEAVPVQRIITSDWDNNWDRDRYWDRNRRYFRRRGLPKDFIDILLLSELFRRRRRCY